MDKTVVELIISTVAKVFIFFLSSGLYIFLTVKGIPHFALRHTFVGERTRDRGIKKYVFEDGRAVVCEPELKYRKYVCQYMLISKNKHKFIKCKINSSIRHIKYDVIAYDYKHKLIDIIGVEERMVESEYTESVLLPPDTSYVRFVIRKVDCMFASNRIMVKYNLLSIIIMCALVVLATVAQGIIINYCLEDLWWLLGRLKATKGWNLQILPTAKVIIRSALLGAVEAALIARIYIKKNVKVTNR